MTSQGNYILACNIRYSRFLQKLVDPQTPNGWKVGDKQEKKMWGKRGYDPV